MTTAPFQDLFELAPDAMICTDATGRIDLVNLEAGRLFGYHREELVAQSIEVLLPEWPQIRHAHNATPSVAVRATRKDGSKLSAEISLGSLETGEGPLLQLVIRDVTVRRSAEADRRRIECRRQQDEWMERLGQLAGGTAHDFNNHLGVIGTYAHFVANEVERAASGDFDRPWHTIRQDLQEIRHTTEQAVQLSHRLLGLARHGVARPEESSLNDVVTAVAPALQGSLGPHVELVTKLSGDLWTVVVDASQIEWALMAVSENAGDAMPEGGTATIETANLHVEDGISSDRTDLMPGRYVRIRVSDTGMGMSAEAVRRAFEPFFTTKPKSQGTGLGLAVVWAIITQAEGRVHLCSEPGLGTTVTALFPARVVPDGDGEVTLRNEGGPSS